MRVLSQSRRAFTILEMVATLLLLGILSVGAATASTALLRQANSFESRDVVTSVAASEQNLFSTRGVFADHTSTTIDTAIDFVAGDSESTRPGEVSLRLVTLGNGLPMFSLASLSDKGQCVTAVAGSRDSASFIAEALQVEVFEQTAVERCTAPAASDVRFTSWE